MDTRELAFLLARLQPPKSVVADPAEVLALKVVVGVLVAVIAKRNESTGESPPIRSSTTWRRYASRRWLQRKLSSRRDKIWRRCAGTQLSTSTA
jgi:hypothetical protein